MRRTGVHSTVSATCPVVPDHPTKPQAASRCSRNR